MLTTIVELKKNKKFKLEEMSTSNPNLSEPISSYTFVYNAKEEKLYISGDVFGEEEHRVVNALEVLFNIAKGYDLVANIDKKMNLRVANYRIVL